MQVQDPIDTHLAKRLSFRFLGVFSWREGRGLWGSNAMFLVLFVKVLLLRSAEKCVCVHSAMSDRLAADPVGALTNSTCTKHHEGTALRLNHTRTILGSNSTSGVCAYS